MPFDQLPALLTAAEVTAWAAAIALLVGVIQQLSWVPIPEGSKARAWAVSILAAAIIGLSLPGVTAPDAPQLILAAVMSWASLAGTSLAVNRAGTYTAQTLYPRSEAIDEEPTLNTRGDAP